MAWGFNKQQRVQVSSAAMTFSATEKRSVFDLDHAGRAGHVDLGQVLADHVEADDQQAPCHSSGAMVSAISRSRAVIGLAAPTGGGEVAARLSGFGRR